MWQLTGYQVSSLSSKRTLRFSTGLLSVIKPWFRFPLLKKWVSRGFWLTSLCSKGLLDCNCRCYTILHITIFELFSATNFHKSSEETVHLTHTTLDRSVISYSYHISKQRSKFQDLSSTFSDLFQYIKSSKSPDVHPKDCNWLKAGKSISITNL